MNFIGRLSQQPLSQWQDIRSRLFELLSRRLPAGETHIWQAAIPLPLPEMQALFAWLSQEERAKALLFTFQTDRDQFIASHGLLRLILATYTKQESSALRFVYNRYGKPRLANCCALSIHFNMSHSGNRVVLALSSSDEVGIDVERLIPGYPWEKIVRHFFSYQEQEYLYSLLPEKQTEAFFTIWTCKEAYWKAKGIGLSGLEADEACLAGERSIFLRQLLLDEEYRGAVAVSGDASVIRCFRLLLAL